MRITSLAPWGVSLALHALLFGGVLALVRTVVPSRPAPVEPALISFSDPAPGGVVLVESSDSIGQLMEQRPMAPAQPGFSLEPGAAARRGLSDTVAELIPSAIPTGTPLESTFDADDARIQRPVQVPDVKFAGVGASNATSVVFVVDGSGSMVSTMPIVRDELKRSLRKLDPAQRFQVIVFRNVAGSDFTAAPHPQDRSAINATPRLIRATRDNVEAVIEWVDALAPSGRSNPILALKQAVALKPDAVFLLSKAITGIGEWEPDTKALLAELDTLNPRDPRNAARPVTIKTIQFLDRDPSGVLEAIGREHGGASGFVFISREELGLR